MTVGRTRESHWQAAEARYLARIRRYVTVEEVSVKEASLPSLKNEELVRRTEAEALLAKLDRREFVVLLDLEGRQMTSEAFARFLEQKGMEGAQRLVFVVGGPFGVAEVLRQRADLRLSLSPMTLPHELAKVVLLEQLYRALTILRGEKYHK